PNRGASAGREDIFENFTNGVGELVRYREEEFTFIADFVNFNGSLNWKPANGHIANLNAEYNLWEPDRRETTSEFSPDGTLLGQSVFQFKENEWNSEVSGDYELDLGPGRFKLIGLQRNEHSPTRAKFFGANLDGTNLANQIADSTTDESESILRGEYNLTGANNSDWQFSLEGAFNSLENEQQRFRGDTFDSVTEVPANPAVRVEEKRAEAFITHGRQLTKDLRLQASLGAEQSEIMSESLDASQTRTFTRPKGSASLAWTVNDKTSVNASIERQVGQLNFFDFVSNVDLNRGDDNTGNVDIVPDQRWRVGIEVERDFGSWGAVTAEVFGEQIEDLIDLVPIFDQGTPPQPIGEGPGNIEDASRFGFEIDGTIKFDNLGWNGAQLEYEVFAQDTFLDDPLTGETRDFNESTIYFYEFNFRHDIPRTDWAWGVNYEKFEEAPIFRRDARRFFIQPQGFAWAFLEHKDIFGMTGTVFYGNLLDSDDDFQRIQYSPDRNGEIVQIEDRSRNFGGILTLRLQGSF
ncbi:MAG: TonB-dependent receptor, partial [Pseudomonadota bacterium]